MPNLQIVGVDGVVNRLVRLMQAVPLAVGRALTQEAEIEAAEAKKRTPVDTGALRSSGHVTPVDYTGQKASVAIVFGGVSVDYAEKVHEDLEAFHRVGQAKFLESVIVESEPYMLDRIARRLKIEELVR